MTKRLVDIDDDLLSAAQRTSGATTIKQTVHRALELLVAQHRAQEVEIRRDWAELGDALGDLQDEDVMRRAWS
ncbi:MAG: type II toxin-antitoxin system VapB family antitoxin [Pseudonocardia sp.]